MKIAIAADHGAFSIKETVKKYLLEKGYEVEDFGALTLDPTDDYPDFVLPMAEAVGTGQADRGIAFCSSGVGACFAANKVNNVRAALITETYSAHQGVEHDDMNVICIGGKVVGEWLMMDILEAFLSAKYSGGERHQRRIDKVKAYEGGK